MGKIWERAQSPQSPRNPPNQPPGTATGTEKANRTKTRAGTTDFRFSTIQRREDNSGENASRIFRISFSSEEPYDRWFGPEILDHSGDACDLSRLNEIGCVLFNHDRDKVVGRIIRAWIENGRGEAEIEFDSDEESEIIYQKVLSGTLRGVSVSYRILVTEDVSPNGTSIDGRFKGPCTIVRKWIPLEVSIVSVPADATVGVGRELEEYTPVPLDLLILQTRTNYNKLGRRST